MQAYELRFYRPDGALSTLYLASFVSDRDAIASARSLLNQNIPIVAVWQESRLVENVTQIQPVLAA